MSHVKGFPEILPHSFPYFSQTASRHFALRTIFNGLFTVYNFYEEYLLHMEMIELRAGRIELFTARVLCRASYRVLEYSSGCASYSPAAVTQVKVIVRKAVYRRTPDSKGKSSFVVFARNTSTLHWVTLSFA